MRFIAEVFEGASMDILDFKADPLRFFHPVLPEKELKKKPVGVQIGEAKIVLYRDNAGKVIALEDRCPHRFTPISIGTVLSNGRIACKYHGWNFGSEGDCKNPSLENQKLNCSIKSYQVLSRHQFIWIANLGVDPATFPEFMEPDTKLLAAYNVEFKAPFHVVFDNFSENEHFPYIHQYFGWNEAESKEVKFSCAKKEKSVEQLYYGPQRLFTGASFFGFKKGSWIRNGWVTQFEPVHSVFTNWFCMSDALDTPLGDAVGKVGIFMTPVGRDKTLMSIFHGVKFLKPKSSLYTKFFASVAVPNVRNDIYKDVHFVEKLKDVPFELDEAVLGKYDRPLVYNRELYKKIYLGHGLGLEDSSHQDMRTETSTSEDFIR